MGAALELPPMLWASPDSWDTNRPWFPQPCDTPDTFAWFGMFLSLLRPRDLRELSRMGCRVPLDRLQGIAHTCMWFERADCYDAHLAAVRFAAIERETETAAEGHARRLDAIRAVTDLGAAEVKRLAKAAARLDEHGTYPGSIRPELAVRSVVQGVKTEALLLGAITPEAAADADLSDLSDDEIETLARLTRRAENAGRRKGA